MDKCLDPASLIACIAVLPALSGCASFFALAPYLDQAVGRSAMCATRSCTTRSASVTTHRAP